MTQLSEVAQCLEEKMFMAFKIGTKESIYNLNDYLKQKSNKFNDYDLHYLGYKYRFMPIIKLCHKRAMKQARICSMFFPDESPKDLFEIPRNSESLYDEDFHFEMFMKKEYQVPENLDNNPLDNWDTFFDLFRHLDKERIIFRSFIVEVYKPISSCYYYYGQKNIDMISFDFNENSVDIYDNHYFHELSKTII